MTAPFVFPQDANLAIAAILGIFFGVSLERGGLGNPHKLTGVFFFSDFVVPKVMFTAILVAASGLYLLSDLGLLDMGRVWIVPTFFWPQLLGGAIFAVGFVVSGYCPGTAVAGLASGRLDALLTLIGIGAGSLLFALLYPALEGFSNSSAMGTPTLPELLTVSHWIVIAGLFLFAGGMFSLMEWYERGKNLK